MTGLQQKISIGLWFDQQAEEAARFYTSVFADSHMGNKTYYGAAGHDIHLQKEGTVMTACFRLANMDFIAVNGGPIFKMNPSISLFVVCETEKEINDLWANLLKDGKAIMPLDHYDWSPRYGWVQDRYGLTWQLAWGKPADTGQKITPCLLFVNEHHGKAKAAIEQYTAVFKNSEVEGILEYTTGDTEPAGTVQHAQFKLDGQTFMAMDSAAPHAFVFNEAISLIIHCRTQEEIDYYWEQLTPGGDPQAQQCGWLRDRFGVSWQVYANVLQQMLLDPDRQKRERVTEAFMKMKKYDIQQLEAAFEGK